MNDALAFALLVFGSLGAIGCGEDTSGSRSDDTAPKPQSIHDTILGPIPPDKKGNLDFLLIELKSEYAGRRAEAIDLLADLGNPRAIEPLIGMVSDGEGLDGSDNWVGGHACNALIKLTGKTLEADEKVWREWWAQHRSEYLK